MEHLKGSLGIMAVHSLPCNSSSESLSAHLPLSDAYWSFTCFP